MGRLRIASALAALGALLALSSCAPVPTDNLRLCAGGLISSPAVVDFNSALTAARLTPACQLLTAELLQLALQQALAAKGR